MLTPPRVGQTFRARRFHAASGKILSTGSRWVLRDIYAALAEKVNFVEYGLESLETPGETFDYVINGGGDSEFYALFERLSE